MRITPTSVYTFLGTAFASTILCISIPQSISLDSTPLSNSTFLQLPTVNETTLSKPDRRWRCYRGGFSLRHRPHYHDCRTAIPLLPNFGYEVANFPVVRHHRSVVHRTGPPLPILAVRSRLVETGVLTFGFSKQDMFRGSRIGGFE